MKTLTFKSILLLFIFYTPFSHAQKANIIVEGLISDQTEMTIPYAAIVIQNTTIGTSSTEEGRFYLSLNRGHANDTLVISTMGYKTYKIKIEDFIQQEIKKIVLEDNVTSLGTIEIVSTEEYIKRAAKQIKKNYVSKNHQLDVLYRRSSIEQNVSKFFVEQYLSIRCKGPGSYINKIQVLESRKSADYRLALLKQNAHSVNYMAEQHPFQDLYSLKKMQWEKIGDTNYDGEGVVVLKGIAGHKWIKLYMGIGNYEIYKIETSDLNAVYIYKKNKDGKLYLSYHNRTWKTKKEISSYHQKLLKLKTPKMNVAYRHEVFVLGIETDKKNINIKSFGGYDIDMGDLKIPYHKEFWANISVPPATKFYKKIKTELESNYGVSLETQFEHSNGN
jgi:hypothetical protein